jgi:hypothetical protein
MTTFKGLTTPSFGFPSLKATFRSGQKKTMELSDNPYDEETICHVTSKIVTPATIENVYLQNMDRLDMSHHQYQSQAILAPICQEISLLWL